MQAMGEPVHIIGDVACGPTQFVERPADPRCDLSVGPQLIDLDGHDAERLADVIVQLTPDAAALFLLCVNQPPGEILEYLVGPLAFGHVHGGTDVFNETAGCVENGMPYCAMVPDRAVRKNGSVIHLAARLFTLCSLVCFAGPDSILRMHPLAKFFD